MRNLIVIAIALGGLALAQEPVVRITPEQVTWVRDTDGSGVERATISGDPTKPGLYVIQVKFPPGTMSLNHYHPEDRHVTVLKGTWYTGTGDELLPDKTIPLKPGSYMKHPAGVHHFDGAKDEEVILQIVGIGPTGTTRLRPELGNYTHILSSGEGKKIVESQCGVCHTVARATAVNQDRDKWTATVRKMVSYGAPMSEREVALSIDYLAKNFGPRVEDPVKVELDRTAKKHIDGICSTCHTAALITETLATREEWLDIVIRMNSKGAGLSEVDVQLLTDYLSKNYGKKP